MGTYQAPLYAGNERVGGLAYRGDFDERAVYRPGEIVLASGVLYACIVGVGTDPALEDTFARPDRVGWGTSSHGEAWETSAGWAADGPPSLADGQGVLTCADGHRDDGQLLGSSATRGNADLLARVALSVPASGSSHILTLALNATEDAASFAQVAVLVANDGTTSLVIEALAVGNAEEDSETAVGPTIVDRQVCWVRLRRVGLAYSASLWAAGAAEPATPQATLTATHAQPAGHPLAAIQNAIDGTRFALTYLSVRPLGTLDAPADDAAHWIPLADALPVPAPV